MEGCGRVSHPLTLGIGRKEVGWGGFQLFLGWFPRLVSSIVFVAAACADACVAACGGLTTSFEGRCGCL